MITCPLFHLIFIFSNPIIVIVTRVYSYALSKYIFHFVYHHIQYDDEPNQMCSFLSPKQHLINWGLSFRQFSKHGFLCFINDILFSHFMYKYSLFLQFFTYKISYFHTLYFKSAHNFFDTSLN